MAIVRQILDNERYDTNAGDVNADHDFYLPVGGSLLHLAMERGHLEVVDLLLQHICRVDVNKAGLMESYWSSHPDQNNSPTRVTRGLPQH